jgi:hypothetical protein
LAFRNKVIYMRTALCLEAEAKNKDWTASTAPPPGSSSGGTTTILASSSLVGMISFIDDRFVLQLGVRFVSLVLDYEISLHFSWWNFSLSHSSSDEAMLLAYPAIDLHMLISVLCVGQKEIKFSCITWCHNCFCCSYGIK